MARTKQMNQGLRFSFQLGLAAALAVTLTGVILSWRVYAEEGKTFREEVLLLAESTANRLTVSQDPVDPSVQQANERVLCELAGIHTYIREISLIDKYGKVDASSVPSENDEGQGTVGPWREDLSSQEVLASEEPFVFPSRWEAFYSVRTPDGSYWGKLRILWDNRRVREIVNRLLVQTAFVAASVGFLGILLGVLMYRTTLSARVVETADRLRYIINSGFRGRVNTAALPNELADLGEQVNRVLDGLAQQQKRVVILEDSLRQTESSYHELQAHSTQESENSEREHEMAMYAFQQLFESTSDGAVLTDGKGSILAQNSVAERWMHLLGQEGGVLTEETLIRLVKRVAGQSGPDRDACTWEVPDPLRGGRTTGRATAIVLRREEDGLVYVLLLLRMEDTPGSRDWLAPLTERFLFHELLPWLSAILSERKNLPEVPVIWELLDSHVDVLARLSALRQVGGLEPSDFGPLPIGPWLGRHLQAADLFSRMISIRFHSSRNESSVWTVDTVLGQVLDLLIEVLLDLAEEEGSTSPVDLFIDNPTSGGVVLRFEMGMDLSPQARSVLRAIGNDRTDLIVPVEGGEQGAWPLQKQVKIVGICILRMLLGCRLDLRQGEVSPLCVRWIFPPGGDHGVSGRAPSFKDSEVRINRLIRNYLTRSWGSSGRRPPSVKSPAART
mgnify:CR=1 FL=1